MPAGRTRRRAQPTNRPSPPGVRIRFRRTASMRCGPHPLLGCNPKKKKRTSPSAGAAASAWPPLSASPSAAAAPKGLPSEKSPYIAFYHVLRSVRGETTKMNRAKTNKQRERTLAAAGAASPPKKSASPPSACCSLRRKSCVQGAHKKIGAGQRERVFSHRGWRAPRTNLHVVVAAGRRRECLCSHARTGTHE